MTTTAPMPVEDANPSFHWWDDALAVARARAWLTGRRHRVRATGDRRWRVSEVGS